jgi:RimJ/RimL family protein N-acetyltransferase
MDWTPKILKGRFVTLEPLAESQREELRPAATADPTIFAYMPLGIAEQFDQWFDWSLNEAGPKLGEMVYVVRRHEDGALVGSTRYLNVSTREPKVEIGHTWYEPGAQGTFVNPEAKYLLMRQAFEDLGCVRVELKTDARNARSRRAMEKMGATFEGVLRKHMRVSDDFVRDSAYYAVLDSDWPEVKRGLEARLAAFGEDA